MKYNTKIIDDDTFRRLFNNERDKVGRLATWWYASSPLKRWILEKLFGFKFYYILHGKKGTN